MNDQIAALVDKLAAKLGVTAEYLWGVLVRQAQIDGILTLMVATAICVATFLMWRKINSIKDRFDSEPAFFIGVIVSVGAILIVSLLLGNTVTAFANPEYWALKQIIK